MESCEDYVHCRNELRRCADDYVKEGQIGEVDSVLEPIMRRYDEILGKLKAKLAICLGNADARRHRPFGERLRNRSEAAPLLAAAILSNEKIHPATAPEFPRNSSHTCRR